MAIARAMDFPPKLWFENINSQVQPRAADKPPSLSQRVKQVFVTLTDERTGPPYTDAEVAPPTRTADDPEHHPAVGGHARHRRRVGRDVSHGGGSRQGRGQADQTVRIGRVRRLARRRFGTNPSCYLLRTSTFRFCEVELLMYGVPRSSPRIGPPFARRWVAWDTGPFAPHYRGRDMQEEAGSVYNERGRERMNEGSGRAQMERRLIGKSVEDESFRQRLIEDPKASVEQELGTRLPEEVRVVTVEETAETIYLVLPSTRSMAGAEGGELSDQQLEKVAGGGTWESGGTCFGGPTCEVRCL